MRAGPLFGTSSQPTRATIGAGLKQPSRACWPACWSMLGGSGSPSHAVKNGRRYRYYVSAALITDAGTDREGWRLAAREIEQAVIRILADALTSPASLVERFGAAGMPSDQVRKLLSRAARMAAALGGSPGERAKLVRELVEKIIVDEKTIIIKLRRGLLLGEDVASSASEAAKVTAPSS